MLWIIPFIIRIFLIDFGTFESVQLPEKIEQSEVQNVAKEIVQKLEAGNRFSAFSLMFWNNFKVCIIHMVGGVMLGIVTAVSLLQNGFFTADIMTNIYYSGMPVSAIMKHTLPHSMEIIGAWLSGAIGFSFAKIIIDYMGGKGVPILRFIKFLGINFFAVLLITLIAAYMEVYVSMSF
jgi:uncharacterized membrane protein SpoIIM required for sporulation